MKLHLLLLACLAILCSLVQSGAPNAGSEDSSNVDPEAFVDYVINFDENHVKKEDMDMVADWLKQRNIEVKENELASYAAYQVATLNRQIGT